MFAHYSKTDPPSCGCCAESIPEFLALDHIGGAGNKHRREIGKVGSSFYAWIVKHGFPDGYRVLCHNCNMATRMGECPHQRQQQRPAVA